MESSAEFDLSPGMIGSVDRKQDHLLEFRVIEDYLLPGDTLALCTDALACWALVQQEAGSPVNWENYWTMPDETWQEEIASIRGRREMRFDDTTLLLLRIATETEETETCTVPETSSEPEAADMPASDLEETTEAAEAIAVEPVVESAEPAVIENTPAENET
jgi:hypothetical protein